MKSNRKWILASALALTGFVAIQFLAQPRQNSAASPPTQTSIAVVTIAETFTPTFEGCAYVWAYQDAPQLTEKINAQVAEINPAASASAKYFGENCVYADGHSTFGAIETDFYINLPITDLSDNDAFGKWISQGMEIVVQIPAEELKGGFGFVEFWFQKSDSEQLVVRVPIQKYLDEARDLTGATLLDYFIERP